MELIADRDGTRSFIKMPGFTFQDFDRTGPSVESLTACMEKYDVYLTEQGKSIEEQMYNYTNGNKLSTTIFTKSMKIKVSEKFFEHGKNVVLGKDGFVGWKMHAVQQFIYLGNTSFIVTHKMMDESSGDMLMQFCYNNVKVDFATRKPIPIDESLKKSVAKHMPSNVDLHQYWVKIEDFTDKKKNVKSSLKIERKVTTGDLDFNKHVYFLNYVNMLNEGFTSFNQKYHPKIGHQLRLTDIDILFEGESVLGDNLEVQVWQSEGEASTEGDKVVLYGSIMLGGKAITYGKVTYVGNTVEAKL